jgi:hypothetical protein
MLDGMSPAYVFRAMNVDNGNPRLERAALLLLFVLLALAALEVWTIGQHISRLF